MRRRLLALSFALTAALPSTAHATYSIIATDPESGRVGAAGASCVPYEVIQIYGDVPGRGAFVAQANFDDAAFDEALFLLQDGQTADTILASVTDTRAFPQAPKMQYGIVDSLGGSASSTGPEALDVAVDRRGELGSMRYAALGNILTSELVVDQASKAFEADACDLAARLVQALEAAGDGGEGDSRCTPDGVPAKSAFVEVSDASGVLLRISVPDVSPADPIVELRGRFDAWRAEHPCPTIEEGGGGAGGGASDGEEPPPAIADDDCAASPASGSHAPAGWSIVLTAVAALRLSTRRARA
ncbi:MAG: DUF1028 domain-containing protein [Polyangiaceae bacterium]|nr:DUF1028 domain-containing protein [Polyangiaceae bacterium]